MNSFWLAVLVTVGFSLVGAAGDYLIKRASEQEQSLQSWIIAA